MKLQPLLNQLLIVQKEKERSSVVLLSDNADSVKEFVLTVEAVGAEAEKAKLKEGMQVMLKPGFPQRAIVVDKSEDDKTIRFLVPVHEVLAIVLPEEK